MGYRRDSPLPQWFPAEFALPATSLTRLITTSADHNNLARYILQGAAEQFIGELTIQCLNLRIGHVMTINVKIVAQYAGVIVFITMTDAVTCICRVIVSSRQSHGTPHSMLVNVLGGAEITEGILTLTNTIVANPTHVLKTNRIETVIASFTVIVLIVDLSFPPMVV